MTKIVDRVQTDVEDERLVRIDESGISVDEGIQSYCVLSVGTSYDQQGNAVYGINMISSEHGNNEENHAEIFVRRAIQLLVEDLDRRDKETKNAEQEEKEATKN